MGVVVRGAGWQTKRWETVTSGSTGRWTARRRPAGVDMPRDRRREQARAGWRDGRSEVFGAAGYLRQIVEVAAAV